ncbi:MAG: cation transporter [Terracidiphilus sp.]|nr:cation transporter [Terracidiphilus sp.]
MNSAPHANHEQACCGGSCMEIHSTPPLPRAVAWLQGITLAWMLLECSVSLFAAARAHSVALLAFGSDSFVELLSAIVVLLQFTPRWRLSKSHAARAAAVLLYALAAVVVLIALTSWHQPTESSRLGIAITAAALVAMPVLATLKRREARRLNNGALAADVAQSATCAWLAAVTLLGLSANALWHIPWIDSAAALVAVPILLVEARRAWRGEGCGCCA